MTKRNVRGGVALALLVGWGIGCREADGCENAPLVGISITDPSAEFFRAVGVLRTVVVDRTELTNFTSDPNGTEHTVGFFADTPGTSFDARTQEVFVLDLDYASPILNPEPEINHGVFPDVHYAWVPFGTELTYPIQTGNPGFMWSTSHVVRNERGLCRISVPWSDIHAPLADGFLQGAINEPSLNKAKRFNDLLQASFRSTRQINEMGFGWQGTYEFCGFEKIGSVNSPTFCAQFEQATSVSIRPSATGLVELESLGTVFPASSGTVLVLNQVKPRLIDAIRETAIPTIEANINNQLQFNIPLTFCDPNASLSAQQDECASNVVAPNAEGVSVLGELLQETVINEIPGYFGPGAEEIAAATLAESFSCAPRQTGGGICQYHPFVNEVVVRPEGFELVVSYANLDTTTNTELLYLYGVALPLVAPTLGLDAAAVPLVCNSPNPEQGFVGTLPTFSMPPAELND
ncbi:MAG: hypothetical protein AAGA56_03265 [Myxococcota bacterium]